MFMKVNAFLKAFVIIQLINLAPTLYAATYAYVACQAGGTNGTINIIDTSTNTVINTITLTGANLITDIAIAPNNQYLYVTATGSSNNVQAVNLATNAITTISVGTAPTSLAITPNSKYVYVVNSTSNSFSVISTATNANIAGSPFSLSGSTT